MKCIVLALLVVACVAAVFAAEEAPKDKRAVYSTGLGYGAYPYAGLGYGAYPYAAAAAAPAYGAYPYAAGAAYGAYPYYG
ncbi:hypothetical protein R5R35_011223 [Gryllus longicercus]|uniref:Uncharacterized protein n=1 Tax=Gryllus longicercus TaxID=2509291 RepID=A0AAN9V4R2_9ORTH